MNKIEQKYFILESLNSEFETHHDDNLKNVINWMFSNKIHSQHTAVLYSNHMKKHNLRVLRLLNKNNEIEYHIHNINHYPGIRLKKEEQDKTAALHAMKIIKDDAQFYLNKGKKIKIQTPNIEQHQVCSSSNKR